MKVVWSLLGMWVALTSTSIFAQTGERLVLIPQGATWRFSDTGVNLGTAWREISYPAATNWSSGPAQLGFGDGDEATPVNGGPSNSRYTTIYFRHTFVLTDPGGITNLLVSLLRDDGGVVYLNGTEIFRSNLPPPPAVISYSTLALNAVPSADETVNFYSTNASPGLLMEGTNVVAVEIHQQGPTSSDLSFDLRLEAIRAPSVGPPAIATQPQNRSVLLGSNATFRVVASGAPPLRYQWLFNDAEILNATNATLTINSVAVSNAGPYRVVITNSISSAMSQPATLTVLDLDSGLREDVEPDIDPFFWSQFSGTVLAANFGGSVSGANSLWFGGEGERFAATPPLDLRAGGAVEFYLRMANNVGLSWETPDLPEEGMVFEYSTNGSTWVILATYDTVLLTDWTREFFELPAGAQSPQTRLRWRQLSNTGECCDNWALDDITIAAPPAPPRIYGQPGDQVAAEGSSATLTVGVSGVHPLSYQWRFKGNDLANATNATLVLTNLTLQDAGPYSVFITNSLGNTLSSNATLTVETLGADFRIASLSTNRAFAIEHHDLTGNERGGLVVSGEHVLYSGEYGIEGFDANTLVLDSTAPGFNGLIVNDLETGVPYALGNGAALMTSVTPNQIINSLHEVNPATGRLTGRRLSLTSPIAFTNVYSRLGLFSGYGRMVIYNGLRAYNISARSGLVTDLGAFTFPTHNYSSVGAFWGVAEYFSNAIHVVYVRDSSTITRTRIPDASSTNLLSGPYLANMTQFSVSPRLNRWYFHSQGGSVFLSGSDILGYADAAFDYVPLVRAPVIAGQPLDQAGAFGGDITFRVGVAGSFPVEYHWQFNGDDLPDATNASLTVGPLSSDLVGAYSVRVSNAAGSVQSSNAMLTLLTLPPDKFQITKLLTNNPYVIDHEAVTGDNRGGLVLSSNEVFYSGDSSTARFSIGDLSLGTSLGRVFDALVSDLQAERVYSLGNGTNPIVSTTLTNRITHLLEHDSDTGLLTGTRLALSTPISLAGNYGNIGIFSGYGRIVLHDGTNLFHIALPSGQVTSLGKLPLLTHVFSESWAYWGVVEFFDSSLHLVYARNSSTIARTRLPDGFTTTLAAFNSLGSGMASLSVSPHNGRWYFHHYGTSQFGSGNEILGFADANFKYSAPLLPPRILIQPVSQTAAVGSIVTLKVNASGTAPLRYQWFVNQKEIPDAISATLTLANLSLTDVGAYAVVVANDLGTATSSNAIVDAVILPGEKFVVSTLSASNSYTVEHRNLTGSDRGGIGASASQIFYNGATATAGFAIEDLSIGGLSPNRGDAFASDLRTELLYLLGTGSTPLPNGGGIATSLIQLDSYTGETTTNVITLSSPINLSTRGGNIGIFSGYGRIVVHNAIRAYDIRLPSGQVTELGVMPIPTHNRTAGWAYWGVAEYDQGLISLVLVQDTSSIVRVRVPDGAVTTIQRFSYLANMNAITVAPYRNRWYFHHEFSSQFTSAFNSTLGFADATFDFIDTASAPVIVSDLANRQVIGGRPFSLTIGVTGQRPLSYQWRWNGADLSGATNATLAFAETTPGLAGTYSVIVSNASGMATSRVASITVRDLFSVSRNFSIASLGTNNSRVIDHDNITGDDRGGIAISASAVFYTGDNSTGRFLAADLSGGTALNRVYDALVSNLKTETVYTLADATNALTSSGGVATRLIQLDSSSGALTTTVIPLSAPIVLSSAFSSSIGLFSGYDRIVVYNGQRVYSIELPDGTVFDHGAMTSPSHSSCENWAYWGVAEQIDNSIYIAYVRSPNIVRTRVPDGLTSVISAFNNLGDMCSFTVSQSRSRWYFHHENSSQFGGTSETIGYAAASFETPASIFGLYNRTILEDTSLGPISFQVLDPGGETSNITVIAVSSSTNLVASSNIVIAGSGTNWTLTATPFAQSNGLTTITIVAQVGMHSPVLHSFTVAVTPVNDAPSFTVPGDITVFEDTAFPYFSGWITNMSIGPGNESAGNSQSLVVTVTNDRPSLFSSQPFLYAYYFSRFADLTFAPAPNVFGSATVTIRAQDAGGTLNGGRDTTTQSFVINVLPVNDRPSFTAGPLVTLREDAGPQAIPNWATNISAGPNETNQSVWFILTPDDASFFSVQPAMDSAGNLTFTPATNASGLTTVRVILHDDGGTNGPGLDTSFVRFLTINISPVNDPPTGTKEADPIVLEDSGPHVFTNWIHAVSGGPADESGQTIALDLSIDQTNLFSEPPSLAADGTLSFTPATNEFGIATGAIRLQDSGGTLDGGDDVTTIPFTIAILPVNDAPSFVGGADQTVPADAGPQTLPNWATAISAGPGGEATQSLVFTVSNNKPGIFAVQPAISSNGTLTFTPAINGSGVANISVTLHDDGGTTNGGVDVSASARFRITVTAVPHAPYANSQTVVLDEDTPTAITLSAGDIDGDPLTYTIGSPAHGTLSGAPPNLIYAPSPNYFGPDSFTFKVSDGPLESSLATVSITVRPVNDPPLAMARAFGPTQMGTNDTNSVFLAPDNIEALVIFDSSRTTDIESNAFQSFWYEQGNSNAFGAGIRVTNLVELGSYTIVLYAWDGSAAGRDTIQLQVITPGEAVARLMNSIDEAAIDRNSKEWMFSSLKAAVKSFAKGNLHPGINELLAFQNKLKAQLRPDNPVLADNLTNQVHEIINALEDYAAPGRLK